MALARSGFWRDFWALFKPYWSSEERWVARGLLATIIALTLGMVYMNVQFNEWYRLFYDAMENRNKTAFWHQMGRFALLAGIWIIMAVYAQYLNQMLQIRWRRWLTDNYLKEWLLERTYYRMQLTGTQTDNPDQRVAEDLKLFVNETLDLSLGLLNAVVTLVSFVGILWTLSGPLEIPFSGALYVVDGYMVWVALIYAALGTWLTHLLGKPLIGLNFDQQRFEADFRFSLARFRENTEGVALYRGEEDELRVFRHRFSAVFSNWWALMKRQKSLTWLTSGYGQLAVIFPYVVGAPRLFSGAIQIGGLVQIANAFGQVQGALSWFIGAYPIFASWKATVDRLTGFHNAIEWAQSQQQTNPGVAAAKSGEADLQLNGVELDLPDGRALLSPTNLRIAAGSRVLISGASGTGKSTLFRALAGIWPFGRGRIEQPREFDALFLPQRPYFPLGTLKEAVTYPAPANRFSNQQIDDALLAVGLPLLPARLEESANWAMQLSGGEQQRVAFARALLHRPRWLFLDEATSALDDAAQTELYTLLAQRLKDSTIVSVAHRTDLEAFHQRRLDLVSDQQSGQSRLLEHTAAG